MTKVLGFPYILKIDNGSVQLSVLGKGKFSCNDEENTFHSNEKKYLYRGLKKASSNYKIFALLPQLPKKLLLDEGVRNIIINKVRYNTNPTLGAEIAIMLAGCQEKWKK